VEVTAADRDRRDVPRLPPGERAAPPTVPPRRVPDLGERRSSRNLMTPRAVAAEGMVDGQQPAARLDRRPPRVRGLAEVDPAHVAKRVGVTEPDRRLLPGHQLDPGGRAGRGERAVVADRVVVVTARKSRPCAAPSCASCATVIVPSECTVCEWKSPARQLRPSTDGSARGGRRSAGGGRGGAGGNAGGAVPAGATSTDISGSRSRMKAMRKSPQALTSAHTAIVARPGRAIGSTTCRSTCSGLAPKTRALSS
jgi:hypothetical protein